MTNLEEKLREEWAKEYQTKDYELFENPTESTADWWLAQIALAREEERNKCQTLLNSGRQMYEQGKKDGRAEFLSKLL